MVVGKRPEQRQTGTDVKRGIRDGQRKRETDTKAEKIETDRHKKGDRDRERQRMTDVDRRRRTT